MKQQSVDAQLTGVIQQHLEGKAGGFDVFAIARAIISSEADLIENWTLIKIAQLVQGQIEARTAPAAKTPDAQMELLPGFKNITVRLPLRDGHRVVLRNATLPQLRESARILRGKAEEAVSKRIEPIQELIRNMEPHAAQHGRGFTVGDYLKIAQTKHATARVAATL